MLPSFVALVSDVADRKTQLIFQKLHRAQMRGINVLLGLKTDLS